MNEAVHLGESHCNETTAAHSYIMQSEVATVPPIPLYFHSTLIAEFCWQLTKLETVLFVYQFSEFIYLCFLPRIRLPQTNIGVPLHTFINLELLANTILLLPSVDVV